MKVEIEVCGFKVAAQTDMIVSPCLPEKDQELIRSAMFIRLCNEAREIAKDYIAKMPIAEPKGGAK